MLTMPRVNETKRGSHLCLQYKNSKQPFKCWRKDWKILSDIYSNKTSYSHSLLHYPAWRNKARGEKQANLAVPGRNCFGVVTVVEAVNAVLKFLAYQSFIFPAALCIGQSHPLAQVFGVIRGCFATVCCKICKTAQTSVLWLNHKYGSQGQSNSSLQTQHKSWLVGRV